MKVLRITAAVTVSLLAGLSMASATTYVSVSDPNLAQQAAAVARVTVVAVEPGPANRAPATDYVVEVDELVQGYLQGGTVVVRVPGGVRADGVGLKIWGSPELQPGEEALLFLQPNADGTYGILHLMLGAFHIRTAGGVEIAEQDLTEAHRLGPPTAAETGESVRDFHRFAAWLADRAAGLERQADYWMERPVGSSRPSSKVFTALQTPDGVPVRWFAFDAGKSVGWSVHSAGQPGLDPAQTVASVQAALQAWTADPTSSIAYVYGGLTSAAAGLGTGDRVNAVLFDDPNGQVPGTFDCKTGGVLAIGGPYFHASTRGFRGQSFHESVEADVVTNDGTECYFRNNPAAAEEVLAHELGHTLGFGHATEAQALMWPKAHNDGRGARLGEDDRAGASKYYGDGSYQPAPPSPTGGTLTLKATASRTEIHLSWTTTFTGVDLFRVESRQQGVFQIVSTVPGSDCTATLSGLKSNQAYTLRITAVRSGAIAGSSKAVRIRIRR
jgi:hypothetical protein